MHWECDEEENIIRVNLDATDFLCFATSAQFIRFFHDALKENDEMWQRLKKAFKRDYKWVTRIMVDELYKRYEDEVLDVFYAVKETGFLQGNL